MVKKLSENQKEEILQCYRMAYLSDSLVNWCPELGTVLANDEISNGQSIRGGHPVVQKVMRQWSMRIKAYAERLLNDIDTVDWSDALKGRGFFSLLRPRKKSLLWCTARAPGKGASKTPPPPFFCRIPAAQPRWGVPTSARVC